MTHQKPEPIVLSGGDIVFARAYPYRPPTARQPHWSWRMTTVKPGQGRVQKYLARLRPEDVPSALAAAYAEVDPGGVETDSSHIRTLEHVLRAWFAGYVEPRCPESGTFRPESCLSKYTVRSYRTAARQLIQVGCDYPLSKLSERDMEQLHGRLMSRYAARTVNLDRKVMHQAMRWARRQDIRCPDVRMPKVKLTDENRVSRFKTPTVDEVSQIIDTLRECPLKLGLKIGLATGARIGEITDLRWRDIYEDEEGHWVRLKGKTGTRKFPIDEADHREWRSRKPDHASEDARLFNTHFRKNGTAQLAKSAEYRGIAGFTFHGLRRLMTDTLHKEGVDQGTYESLMGHNYGESVRTYRRPTDDDRRAAMDAIRRSGASAEAHHAIPTALLETITGHLVEAVANGTWVSLQTAGEGHLDRRPALHDFLRLLAPHGSHHVAPDHPLPPHNVPNEVMLP